MILKFPSVHTGYTVLKEYLDKKHFKIDILQKDELSVGLKHFCDLRKQKLDSYDGLVLTALDNPDTDVVHSINRRSIGNSSDTNLTDIYLFGPQCAALFNQIIVVNSTVTSEQPIATSLVLDADASIFSCSALNTNDSSV
jgi:hypothetical protein